MKVNSDILKEANAYKLINNGLELQTLVIALLESAKFESSGIFSTPRAFHRQEKAGAHSLSLKAMKKHSIRARVLVPMDEGIMKILMNIRNKV